MHAYKIIVVILFFPWLSSKVSGFDKNQLLWPVKSE